MTANHANNQKLKTELKKKKVQKEKNSLNTLCLVIQTKLRKEHLVKFFLKPIKTSICLIIEITISVWNLSANLTTILVHSKRCL